MAAVAVRQLLPLLLPLQQAAQLGAVGQVGRAAQQQEAVLNWCQFLQHRAWGIHLTERTATALGIAIEPLDLAAAVAWAQSNAWLVAVHLQQAVL